MKACKKRKTVVRTSEEIWDKKCQQAIVLFNQGTASPDIAKKGGCHVSNLYRVSLPIASKWENSKGFSDKTLINKGV
ncbi:hypothetical protein BLD50_20660 [Bacillus cereus]|nr:hypothetical protein BLD50_20660 [Bacillus cereus]